MQPRIEFPESLLKGRPAPPPITLDELQALPVYKELGIKARYSKRKNGIVIKNLGLEIYVKKELLGFGAYPLNLKISDTTWEALLVDITLYLLARRTDNNYRKISNIWYSEGKNSIILMADSFPVMIENRKEIERFIKKVSLIDSLNNAGKYYRRFLGEILGSLFLHLI
jgi:hypothetical protein